MVVHYLAFVGVAVVPSETDPVLIVDPDAVLTASVATEFFQAASWWHSQIVQILCIVEYHQLSLRLPLYVTGELPDGPSFCYRLGIPVSVALDHF